MCEAKVGARTRVWAFAHVMPDAKVGSGCNIGEHAFVESGAVIGDRVTIKNGVMIWKGVTIDSDAFVGPGVIFTNDRFPRSPRGRVTAQRYADESWLEPTRVSKGASVGAGAIIGPGITIGAYAFVAAGAIVTRDVAPYRLVAGNPARAIGWVDRVGRRTSHPPKSVARKCDT